MNHMKRLLYTDDNGSPSPKRLSPTLLQRFGPSDEQRRLTMCCQGCCSAKLKSSNEWTLHNLHSWPENAKIVSCADCRVPTRLKTSFLADNTCGSTLKVFFAHLLLSFVLISISSIMFIQCEVIKHCTIMQCGTKNLFDPPRLYFTCITDLCGFPHVQWLMYCSSTLQCQVH